ncbi:MAG: YbfB/YjiJ family MFS transporter, partial [Acetobacteraceae bacterium]
MRWHPALAGLAASLVGIGLARFAYTPLIPALIGAHWFAPAAVVYFGAANLAGYLVGALLARRSLAWVPAFVVLRAMMVLASLSFFASAAPVSVVWYFAWRLVSGICGGFIMVLAAPTVLPTVDPARRGLVSGLIFTGVGLGIGASGTMVPLLLRAGLAATWCGLGVLSVALTALAWGGWPRPAIANGVSTAAPRRGGLLG